MDFSTEALLLDSESEVNVGQARLAEFVIEFRTSLVEITYKQYGRDQSLSYACWRNRLTIRLTAAMIH